MEAHTPKRFAVEKYVQRQKEHARGWNIQVIDEQEEPVLLLQATAAGQDTRTLEVHSRQVTLTGDDLDPSTQKMISRWMESLATGKPAKA